MGPAPCGAVIRQHRPFTAVREWAAQMGGSPAPPSTVRLRRCGSGSGRLKWEAAQHRPFTAVREWEAQMGGSPAPWVYGGAIIRQHRPFTAVREWAAQMGGSPAPWVYGGAVIRQHRPFTAVLSFKWEAAQEHRRKRT